jgi:hypothetical protein
MSPVNRATSAASSLAVTISSEVTTCIKQRSTAVAGLDGCADLKIARVIAKPRERAYIPN